MHLIRPRRAPESPRGVWACAAARPARAHGGIVQLRCCRPPAHPQSGTARRRCMEVQGGGSGGSWSAHANQQGAAADQETKPQAMAWACRRPRARGRWRRCRSLTIMLPHHNAPLVQGPLLRAACLQGGRKRQLLRHTAFEISARYAPYLREGPWREHVPARAASAAALTPHSSQPSPSLSPYSSWVS